MNVVGLWEKLKPYPGGKWIFSRIMAHRIPYSGTVKPRVVDFSPGHAKIQLVDRRAVRNHLQSVHAVALMNLAELTSGLAMVGGLPDDLRGILVGFRIEYLKKARGVLTAESCCDVPKSQERKQHEVMVEVKNSDGDTVCRAYATWLIGPSK